MFSILIVNICGGKQWTFFPRILNQTWNGKKDCEIFFIIHWKSSMLYTPIIKAINQRISAAMGMVCYISVNKQCQKCCAKWKVYNNQLKSICGQSQILKPLGKRPLNVRWKMKILQIICSSEVWLLTTLCAFWTVICCIWDWSQRNGHFTMIRFVQFLVNNSLFVWLRLTFQNKWNNVFT